jgi:hypothetical protein
MNVSATTIELNSSIELAPKVGAGAQDKPLVAFGIGQVNKPEVELSAQGKILQQAEQVQQVRQQSLQQPKQKNEAEQSDTTNKYIRVSSSVGNAQRNNLSADEATEIYRSIEKLL